MGSLVLYFAPPRLSSLLVLPPYTPLTLSPPLAGNLIILDVFLLIRLSMIRNALDPRPALKGLQYVLNHTVLQKTIRSSLEAACTHTAQRSLFFVLSTTLETL
jgi:hypothetical protein